MIGLFDSGRGGENTLEAIREISPLADIIFLADRENAPYGIRNEEELVRLSICHIDRMSALGADKILIGCCTASTVYQLLPEKYKRLSIPIVEPIANAARAATKAKRIGVAATERTVRSHAFARKLDGCEVYELALQELVGFIDGGMSDASMSPDNREYLNRILSPLFTLGIDTLILGCTHFPAVADTVRDIVSAHGSIAVIDSAREGALALVKEFPECAIGNGRIIRLESKKILI